MAHEFVTDCAITQFGIPLSSTVHRRNATTAFANSVPIALHNPTPNSRALVRHLAASNKSLDGIMTALLAFIPDLNQLEEILLAIEAVGQFFTPAPSTLEPMLVDNMPQIAPALRISVLCLPTAGGVRPVDMPHFSESDSLTVDIDSPPNPTFSPPQSLTTNMCGLGVLGRACPSLRRLFFHQGALEALCGILRLDHSAYFHVHAVCYELYGLLRCEVSSSYALERALKCGLLDIIVYAVSIFGQYPARTCGTMPSILQYISDWCLRSRRIAIRVHGLLTALRSNTELWESLPKLLPSQNGLTVAFHQFLDKIASMVVLLLPEREKILIPCMNSKCDDKVCESKRYKRCAKCKAFVVCSRACFKAAYKAGEHTRADCTKSLDELDALL
ncbi:hypothetical protein CPB85DRAFT_1340657 [Mucidula mucida]|nr:hypothetical protein CPB85DRAFT_1340657 [Mucidula mucida]